MKRNELYISKDDDWFMQMFLARLFLRPVITSVMQEI